MQDSQKIYGSALGTITKEKVRIQIAEVHMNYYTTKHIGTYQMHERGKNNLNLVRVKHTSERG